MDLYNLHANTGGGVLTRAPALLISRLVSWLMIFGAALLGPQCRHGLSGERSSWLLFVVGLELPVPSVSVLPVSSVPEVFDRWSAGERSELIGSEFLDVLASVPDRGTTRSEVFADGFVGDRGSGHCAGCAAMLVLPHGATLPMMFGPIRGPVPAAQ
ncbi:hypothetical protein I551_6028 [Mycobacterium ulcerans str. Harvey]|uniref:Uncharacterized protein n=1 Tax=Mycobacterium ulcerans str. Harvey TaxID=1299332 RepID=A0ABN0QS98_MYCUL|nr:hypothetical protein I551_6028 [Mycobacterium ulcerans str. Harvey]